MATVCKAKEGLVDHPVVLLPTKASKQNKMTRYVCNSAKRSSKSYQIFVCLIQGYTFTIAWSMCQYLSWISSANSLAGAWFRDPDLNPVKDLKQDWSTSVPLTPYQQVAWHVQCEDRTNSYLWHPVQKSTLFLLLNRQEANIISCQSVGVCTRKNEVEELQSGFLWYVPLMLYSKVGW
mgnify:CR=1 FL=1